SLGPVLSSPAGAGRCMRKGASAEQDFIVAFRPSSNAVQNSGADFVRLVSPLSDGAEVQLQTFEDDASPRPQITRSVSDPALRRSFDSPRSGRPRRNSTLTSNVSDFYLTVNGNHQWSPDDVAVEEDEEESGEHMRHALSDQGPNGKLELFVRSKSGVIRQMVEEEKKRWEETQEEWLYEAQQVNDFHHEAGKRWAFQRPMGGISEQMYLDDSQSVCMISARIKVSRLLQSQFFELALGLVIV
ncbi:RPL15, partial [Symbiodinium microadriaticum]